MLRMNFGVKIPEKLKTKPTYLPQIAVMNSLGVITGLPLLT
jgi:hypothetical protein